MKSKYDTRFIEIISIQVCFILFFSLIYYSILDHFTCSIKGRVLGYVDCLALSTTIQSGVGITPMLTATNTSTILLTLHQAIVIISGAYILFTFTMDL